MNSVNKLYKLGCGNEMVKCQQERDNLNSAIWNAKKRFKYCKEAIKNNILNIEDAYHYYMKKYYSELVEQREMAEKYNYLYMEQFCKITLAIEKFFSKEISDHS